MSNSIGRRVINIVVIVVSSFLVLYTLCLLLVHFPPIQNRVLNLVEDRISSAVTGDVKIKRFRTNLLSWIVIIDSEAQSSEPGVATSRLRSMEIGYRLLPLADKKISIRKLRMSEGELYAVHRGERILLPILPAPELLKTNENSRPAWRMTMDSLTIEDVFVHFRDEVLNLSVTLEKCKAVSRPNRLDSVPLWITARKGMLDSRWWSGPIDSLFANSVATISRIFFSESSIQLEGWHIAMTGLVPYAPDDSLSLNAVVHSNVQQLDSLIPIPKGLEGVVVAYLAITGTPIQPEVDVQKIEQYLETFTSRTPPMISR